MTTITFTLRSGRSAESKHPILSTCGCDYPDHAAIEDLDLLLQAIRHAQPIQPDPPEVTSG
jgi:hypothetical protein